MYSDERTAKSMAGAANLGQVNARAVDQSAGVAMRPVEQRPAGTIGGIISHAESVHGMSVERLRGLTTLTDRAVDLALRLAGPFPTPGTEPSEKSAHDDASISALDEAQRRVAELRRPLRAMDLELARLDTALDAIERAFG